MVRAKNYETMSTLVEVMHRKLWPLFSRTRCRMNSLLYAVRSCLGKILNTRSKDIINACMDFFNSSTVSETLTIRKRKFLNRYLQSDNV